MNLRHRSIGVVLLGLVLGVGLSGACTAPGASSASPLASSAPPLASTTPGPTTPGPTPAGPPATVLGKVTAGPVCPVERASPDPSCAPRPVHGAVIVVTDASTGIEVSRGTTGADGSYAIVVPATGTFLVTGLPVPGLMRVPAPVTITLTFPSQHERVDLIYDTGIR